VTLPRFPLLPTILVGLAVATMIALGFWQLDRRGQKEAMLARYAGNSDLPVMAFPRIPVGDHLLFRRATAFCLQPVGWQTVIGRTAGGESGWRHIAECRTGGAEGPPLKIDVGVSRDPKVKPVWTGGEVTGSISQAPDSRPLIAGLLRGGGSPRALMLVAETPAQGLEASARPNPASIPNNHLTYAVQWFAFALIALVIYVLALRLREKKAGAPLAPPPPHG
jgi:cytochrome oxidase assembly protein ShyY1